MNGHNGLRSLIGQHRSSIATSITAHEYTGIKSFSFLRRPQRIVGQKVSTNCRMAALPDCFPSSSCRLLREYWNFVPNNTNVHVKEIKTFTAVQDLVLIFRPTMHCVPNKGNS